MHTTDDKRNPVEELAEEFFERRRNGEKPTLQEYTENYPQWAEEIHDLFPALAMMEDLGADPESMQGLNSHSVADIENLQLDHLGDYHIIREVGRGGMGIVYEAEQESLGRRVALKVLPKQMLLDPKQKKRFSREAKAAAKLHHTNIVSVFGVGEHEGLQYYAMQFIHGLGLDEVLTELKQMRPASGGRQPTGTLTKSQTDGEKEGLREGEKKTVRHDLSAALVAQSLLTGHFDRTVITDDIDSSLAETIGFDRREGEAPAEPLLNAQSSTLDSTTTGRLSDTFTLPGYVVLPGQSESSAMSQSKKTTYWQSVARIGIQVGEGLQHAHDQGILHRDIKPSNLLLDSRGTVWVTDFGLAKHTSPFSSEGQGVADENLTATGDIVGTLRYMPPEAFNGKADSRGDIYSLGLTLYELLVLQPAFNQLDRHRLIKQVTSESPESLRKLEPSIPRDLVTIIHKTIDRDPSHRYQTAQELTDDLQRYLHDEPIKARRISPVARIYRWCKRNPMATTVAALFLICFLGSCIAASVFLEQAEDNALLATELKGALGDAEENLDLAKTEKKRAEENLGFARTEKQRANENLKLATDEQKRAEENFDLAMKSLNAVYLQAIGQQRLLGEKDPLTGEQQKLTPQEKRLLKTGLDFYVEIANQNENSTTATYQIASAFLQLGVIQTNLEDKDAAEKAFNEATARLKRLTEKYPDNPRYFKQLGQTYYKQGSVSHWMPNVNKTFVHAERTLGKAIELDPTDAETYEFRGNVYKRLRQFKKAIDNYAHAVDLDSNSASMHRALAWILGNCPDRNLRDGQRAVKHARKAVKLEPENADFHNILGNLYWTVLRDRAQAMREIDKAIELDPNSSASFKVRARVNLSADLTQSLEDAQKAVQLNLKSAAALRTRGLIYSRLGRYEEALSDYSAAIQLDPNHSGSYLQRGNAYKALHQYQNALQDFNKALELAPMSWINYNNRAAAHFHLKQYSKALADITKSLELYPERTNALVWISPSLVAACPDEAFRKGILDLADKALDLSSKPVDVHATRATLFEGLGEISRVDAELTKIIELEPDNAKHWNRRGLSYARRGIKDKAHTDYSKAIELDPNNWVYRFNRGFSNRQIGRLDESLVDLSKAHELNPKSTTVLAARANLHIQRNEWEKTLTDYSTMIELDPKNTTFRYWKALVLLHRGDEEGYRQICMTMVEKEFPQWTPWTCALAPAAVKDYAVPIALAQKSASGDPQNPMPIQHLGAILFRAGKAKDAIAQLTKAEQMLNDPSQARTSPAYTWFLLSMAHHRAGNGKEARTYLSKAIEQAETELNNETTPPAWNRRLTLQLFRKEAETLINGPTKNTNTKEPTIAPKPK